MPGRCSRLAGAARHGATVERWARYGSAGHASTTSRTSTSRSRGTPWSCSPACPGRASRRWPSAPSTPRRSGATWSRSSPYARRLFHQLGVPEVDEIDGLPPAVALQQQRGAPTTRSSVGSVTTLSNLLRMLYSRAGDYPPGQPQILYAESFSPNTPEGACPNCHGLGRVYDATEASMVPGRRADHPRARHRRLAAGVAGAEPPRHRSPLGYDVDRPWRDLPQEGPRLDAVHRRAAAGAGLRRPDPGGGAAGAQAEGGAQLPGHVHAAPGGTCWRRSRRPRARR